MREEFNELNVPDGHYLKIAKNSGNIYFDEFIESVSKIKQFISNRDFKDLWGNKLQLKKAKFDEKAYIQSACELAVANYFCEKNGFRVEAKVNPKNQKDVDVKFQSNNFTYNIEVKCSAFTNREKVQNTESFKYQTYGRLDNRLDIMSILSNAIDEGLIKQGKSLKEHSELKSMDNNLKDFLINAHEKFNDLSKENEINILLICCGDREDMQSWVGYLNGPEGLFTNGSFCDPADYNNVDLVILTNLYYKHKDFYNKNIENSWNLNETLNLSIINPYCRLRKPKGIENFDSEMINYNSEINQFKVPGLAPEVLKDARKVVHFVIDYLEIQEGKYLFDKKSSN